MDNQIKTSFIPRAPISTSPTTDSSGSFVSRKSVGRTLFSLVAIMIFLVSIVAYAGTFLWQKQLESNITRQQEEMRRSLEGFDERFVKEATRLDTRIQEASKILVNHVSPSTLYALLSQHTLRTVSFSSFSFSDFKAEGLKVVGEGEASRYESIVLQSDEFGRSGYMRNVLFTNLRQNTTNDRVQFSFEAQIDPRLILYKDKGSVLTSISQ